MPPNETARLNKTLTVSGAVALAITMVVGAGILVLPGLAYKELGNASIYAWLSASLLVVPLLFIFSYLGARHPSAGGIAGFMHVALGRRFGHATEMLAIGAFVLGIPAIAFAGGNYLSGALGGSRWIAGAGTLCAIALGCASNAKGASLSGTIQKVLSWLFIAALGFAAIAPFFLGGDTPTGGGIAPASSWPAGISGVGLVFFAFTGWEMLSFTSEEYVNPKRDYPLSVAISFLVIVGLYVALVMALQTHVDPLDPRLAQNPLAALLAVALGPNIALALGVVAFVIVLANVNGATWAASRAVFASARAGFLPSSMAKLSGSDNIPRRSIFAVCTVFMGVAGFLSAGVVTQESLLTLAGQNFFILYGLAVVSYIVICRSLLARAFGVVVLGLCVSLMGTFGWSLVYPVALMAFGWLASGKRQAPAPSATAAPATS